MYFFIHIVSIFVTTAVQSCLQRCACQEKRRVVETPATTHIDQHCASLWSPCSYCTVSVQPSISRPYPSPSTYFTCLALFCPSERWKDDQTLTAAGWKTNSPEKKRRWRESPGLWTFPIWWPCLKARPVFIQTSGSTDQASIRSHVVAPLGTEYDVAP